MSFDIVFKIEHIKGVFEGAVYTAGMCKIQGYVGIGKQGFRFFHRTGKTLVVIQRTAYDFHEITSFDNFDQHIDYITERKRFQHFAVFKAEIVSSGQCFLQQAEIVSSGQHLSQ